MHRKLYSQTPQTPHPTTLVQSLQNWKDLLMELHLISASRPKWTPVNIMGHLDLFSYHHPNATMFVRTFLNVRSFLDTRDTNHKSQNCSAFTVSQDTTMLKSYISTLFPDTLYLDSESIHKNQDLQRLVSDFLTQFTTLFVFGCKVYSLNRSRQRRQLYHLLLQWEGLEQHLLGGEHQMYALYVSSVKTSSHQEKKALPEQVCNREL